MPFRSASQTFDNAMLFNPQGHWVHEAAKKLASLFEEIWKETESRIQQKKQHLFEKNAEITSPFASPRLMR